MPDFDLIIIGAGPAGMIAAGVAARAGATVALFDEQARAGGQIFRNAAVNDQSLAYLGKDYFAGRALIDGLNHPNISHHTSASVWRIEPGPRIVWSNGETSRICSARHILLAVGAQERSVPFPGWTIPGVMPVGAAQVLMKSSGLLPKDTILAGSGPLVYLVAAQLIDAGQPPKALVETQTSRMMWEALKFLPGALRGTPTLLKGLGLIQKIRSARIQRYQSAAQFKASALQNGEVSFTFVSRGKTHVLETDLLLVHQGVVPSTHISRSAGIDHVWDEQQFSYRPVTLNRWGETNIPAMHVAGDGSGIGGADAAIASGHLAALNLLFRLGRLDKADRDRLAAVPAKALSRAMSVRPFLDTAYAPSQEFLVPRNDTIVCRCEDVRASEIVRSVNGGATGPRQVKAAVRTGMGPCQGRMCELPVQGILSSKGIAPDAPRARSPIKPVKLGEIAALPLTEERVS